MPELPTLTVCETHGELNCGCINADRYSVVFD